MYEHCQGVVTKSPTAGVTLLTLTPWATGLIPVAVRLAKEPRQVQQLLLVMAFLALYSHQVTILIR
jgi:hypothetical protein